jgi:hypothetical protein
MTDTASIQQTYIASRMARTETGVYLAIDTTLACRAAHASLEALGLDLPARLRILHLADATVARQRAAVIHI